MPHLSHTVWRKITLHWNLMMQSIKTPWAVALGLTVLALSCPAFAEEAAEQPQTDTVDEAVITQTDTTDEAVVTPAEEEAPAADIQMPPVASHEDISYSIGFTIGADMVQRGADFDVDQVVEGIRAGLGQNESRLTQEQIAQSLFSFQMQMQQEMMQASQDNFLRGRAYLDENAEKEGIVVTESGLQYRVIQSGDGAIPTVNDVVAARYRGTLIDGTEFDRSPENETVSFPVGRVIPGWVEALQLMKVGDKWELTIPADLAYGERGSQQGTIGPNEVLIFEIELVAIEPTPEPLTP
jgi:FKBP-type peptidyl-prolyl cis-trans isomerase